MHSRMNTPVTASVTQPPSLNLITAVTTRMPPVTSVPSADSSQRRCQCGCVFRTSHQCRTMPSCDSVKVRNTLMEYMTTSSFTSPREYTSVAIAARPMVMMPFCVTNRSDRCAKRLGTHWSTAMAASVAGPARKPVCAATNSSAPSLKSVNTTIQPPTGKPASVQSRVKSDHSEALSVRPGSCTTLFSR